MRSNRNQRNRDHAKEIISVDTPTLKHTQRVSNFTEAFSEFMNWPVRKIETLKTMTFLHDLGKTAVRDVMNKRRRLNDAEYRLMRLHTVFGFIIGEKMEVDNTLLIPILAHHNNFIRENYVSLDEIKLHEDEIFQRAKDAYQISATDISKSLRKLELHWDKYNTPDFDSRVLTLWDSFDAATGTGRIHMKSRRIDDIVEEFNTLFGIQFEKRLENSFIGFTKSQEYHQLVNSIYHHTVR